MAVILFHKENKRSEKLTDRERVLDSFCLISANESIPPTKQFRFHDFALNFPMIPNAVHHSYSHTINCFPVAFIYLAWGNLCILSSRSSLKG
jgi:hypothetical protein